MPFAKPPSALSRLPEVIELLQHVPCGLITDVDGTISEVAPTPDQAVVSAMCRQHLAGLCASFDLVAAVSGRPAADVARMIELDQVVCVGNHGLERWKEGHLWVARAAKDIVDILPGVRDDVERCLDGIAGLYLERKTYGLAVHYRSAAEPEQVRQAVLHALDGISSLSLFSILEGRKVVELRPRGRIHKGWAVRDLARRHGLRSLIYLGDDVTDADAFRSVRRLRQTSQVRGSAIAVLNSETSHEILGSADLSLEGVEEVETFLGQLVGGPVC